MEHHSPDPPEVLTLEDTPVAAQVGGALPRQPPPPPPAPKTPACFAERRERARLYIKPSRGITARK